jgi:hypothetical protein
MVKEALRFANGPGRLDRTGLASADGRDKH